MPTHSAKGKVVIQVIEGRLILDVAGTRHSLEAGVVLVLAPGIPHDVEADEKAKMLLTVARTDSDAQIPHLQVQTSDEVRSSHNI
jgi:quercetin dioxygenase-like cupin family protein